MDIDRAARHVWVNLPDFTARIVDHGRTVFETRVVIGKNVADQRSPEFSDQMEHMVINPSWGVPRSIIVKEYLPLLQRNPNAVGASAGDRRARAAWCRAARSISPPIRRKQFPLRAAPAALGRQCAGAR